MGSLHSYFQLPPQISNLSPICSGILIQPHRTLQKLIAPNADSFMTCSTKINMKVPDFHAICSGLRLCNRLLEGLQQYS